MRILLDSNLLLRSIDPTHAQHSVAAAAVRSLAIGGTVNIVPQNIYELWVVATRPKAANGLGMAPSEIVGEVSALQQTFELVPDTPAIFDEWLRLVARHDCRGKPAHDARLVAAMKTHGITHLLTFNGHDFARYSDIQVLDPAAVAAGRLGAGAQASQPGGAGGAGGAGA